MITKRKRFKRRPPVQRTQKEYTATPYGSFVPFLQVAGKRVSPLKPDALLLRRWSRNNPVVRRCINVIKDRLTSIPHEFAAPPDGNDYSGLIGIWESMLQHPNNTDTQRSFFDSISEDLVAGDCGCFEIAATGNPYRPYFLFPTDGFTMNFVLEDPVYSYAQRICDNIVATPENYVFFKPTEIMYMKKHNFTNNPYGLSPIQCAFEYIKALTQTFTYSSDIASNALPKYMANIKGISQDILDAYRGYFMQECMGQPVLPMVSAEDIKAVQIAPISEEATFMQYQQFVIAIIALCFGIPPEKLAIAKSNDRSTIAEINENLLADCIRPYAGVWDDAVNHLLQMNGVTQITFRHIFEESLADKQTKQNMVTSLYQQDAITRNEMRRMLGLSQANDEFSNEFITIYKAKVNEKYGINGFGDSKNNAGGENN